MNMIKSLQSLQTCARKNAPTILTTMGIFGVVGTAILAVKDSKKAEVLICKRNEYKIDKYGEELTTTEKVIAATPAYLPTMLSGVATISCIYGANKINQNRQALLMSAYSYLNNCFNEYKDATKELYGEDANEKIEHHIIQNKAPQISNDIREDSIVVYEEYSDTYITTTRKEIENALYNANRHFNVFGALSINNFLDLLDVDEVDKGFDYGWSYHKNYECDGVSWIDATLERVKAPDEHPLYKICWNLAPSIDYVEWHIL